MLLTKAVGPKFHCSLIAGAFVCISHLRLVCPSAPSVRSQMQNCGPFQPERVLRSHCFQVAAPKMLVTSKFSSFFVTHLTSSPGLAAFSIGRIMILRLSQRYQVLHDAWNAYLEAAKKGSLPHQTSSGRAFAFTKENTLASTLTRYRVVTISRTA